VCLQKKVAFFIIFILINITVYTFNSHSQNSYAKESVIFSSCENKKNLNLYEKSKITYFPLVFNSGPWANLIWESSIDVNYHFGSIIKSLNGLSQHTRLGIHTNPLPQYILMNSFGHSNSVVPGEIGDSIAVTFLSL